MHTCVIYGSANIKVLETLGYAEHICNYVVILDSWFYGKIASIVDLITILSIVNHTLSFQFIITNKSPQNEQIANKDGRFVTNFTY
jgi:hypothetical protein